MKKLYDEFEGRKDMKNCHFNKIDEIEWCYLYQVTISDDKFHFEVFKKRVRNGNEIYPTDRDFRIENNAWIYFRLGTAKLKLSEYGD